MPRPRQVGRKFRQGRGVDTPGGGSRRTGAQRLRYPGGFQAFATPPGASRRIQTLRNSPHWHGPPEVCGRGQHATKPRACRTRCLRRSGLLGSHRAQGGRGEASALASRVVTCRCRSFPTASVTATAGAPCRALALCQALTSEVYLTLGTYVRPFIIIIPPY